MALWVTTRRMLLFHKAPACDPAATWQGPLATSHLSELSVNSVNSGKDVREHVTPSGLTAPWQRSSNLRTRYGRKPAKRQFSHAPNGGQPALYMFLGDGNLRISSVMRVTLAKQPSVQQNRPVKRTSGHCPEPE